MVVVYLQKNKTSIIIFNALSGQAFSYRYKGAKLLGGLYNKHMQW